MHSGPWHTQNLRKVGKTEQNKTKHPNQQIHSLQRRRISKGQPLVQGRQKTADRHCEDQEFTFLFKKRCSFPTFRWDVQEKPHWLHNGKAAWDVQRMWKYAFPHKVEVTIFSVHRSCQTKDNFYFFLKQRVSEGQTTLARYSISKRSISWKTQMESGWQLCFVGWKSFWRTRPCHSKSWHLGLVNEERSLE